MKYPTDRQYAASHEWLRQEADGTWTLGITDHAQGELGDLVFVDLPTEGSEIAAGAAVCVVESVKAASDVYSPVAATVVAVNSALADQPELVNQAPHDGGWLVRLKVAAAPKLMDAAAYSASLGA